MKCPNCGEPLTLYIIGTESAYPFGREYACRGCGFIGFTTSRSPSLHKYAATSSDIPRLVFLYRERVA